MADTKTKPADEDVEPVRYAAYDNTLLRFVGAVQTTKKAVNEQDSVKAAKEAGHDLEVREV